MKKKKYNEKQSKKIRNLVVICVLCGVVLAASTYAWFIGMKTVNVSSFDIKIATTEGLYLSMDGKSWTYELDVDNAPQYANNANQLEDVELVPMSTIGEMDTASSRMKLYEKGSLTATPGGYRLLASQVDNNVNQVQDGTEYLEGNGYVAFDLFIKNLSGEAYYVDNNPLNEEAIYLTTNSAVTIGEAGEQNTGIENSIRVAFAQLGRVSADVTDQARITGITCANNGQTTDADYITGICRTAQVWEPNDTAHVQNAINWYEKACNIRNSGGTDVEANASYNLLTPCTTVEDGTAYQSYVVGKEINVGSNVNVYDGARFNTYTKSIEDGYLVDLDTFTDTEKDLTGTARPAFMTLAPNSITKVRVYVYLEGQDVDNYDFAQLGKQITVNFGFTKERFTEDDVDHEGPDTDITERKVDYSATGAITNIVPDTITYDTNAHQFTVPADHKADFTFTDGASNKTATYSNADGKDSWKITDTP